MVFDQFKHHLPDIDPGETEEWVEALDSVVENSGRQRAQFLLYKILKRARMLHVGLPQTVTTRPINTFSPEQEPWFPGDESMERRVRRLIRWNAAVMVTRANDRYPGLGGHLSSYASSASLYEVGFNHFFRGRDEDGIGDQIYFQGHSAPGIYARAYLEGRLSEEQLDHFRRESTGRGLSSYPHPRLMPDFWEYPTVSMGLGPMNALYQARFLRYLHNRGLKDTSNARVWCFMGDGESDEPESLGALTLAAREGLDNLIFVVNCNLQRLDGPVRGNGQIVQELEARFRGAGWDVIKVLLGREWDELLARDVDGLLVQRMTQTLDGDWQRYSAEDGATVRQEFFGTDQRLLKLVEHLDDAGIERLRMGGHDYRKLYSAYHFATENQGTPTCILARTVKGWTLGEGFEARNMTHQMKKLGEEELKVFRDRLELPISDEDLENAPYYRPPADSEEMQYLAERRAALGGPLPARRATPVAIDLPKDDLYAEFRKGTGPKVPVSTTMAFVRLLRALMKDEATIGDRVVPIIPDEARTFGMESLFREFKIYAAQGQLYKPVDWNVLLSYTEGQDGQILEEGITEAGAMASFTASGTSYATVGETTIPFFIFYSMFGFQRVGDSIWAAADSRARGFLMGATYGRTTLNGEGLQHQDGHSLLVASTVPNCLAYDPAFHYETATIVREGLRRMVEQDEDVFYYITLYNENYEMPDMPEDCEEGILRGMYLYRPAPDDRKDGARVQLFGSGVILQQVLRAQQILAEDYDVAADVWSVTSYSELRHEALEVDRRNRLRPEADEETPLVTRNLEEIGADVPVIAATDSMKAVADQIRPWVRQPYHVLGTDGFGRSDTREALRRFFENDAEHVVFTALAALVRLGRLDADVAVKARERFGIDPDRPDPARTDAVGPPADSPKDATSGSRNGKGKRAKRGVKT